MSRSGDAARRTEAARQADRAYSAGVAVEDQQRWDQRYRSAAPAPDAEAGLPDLFAPFVDEFPDRGDALDIACGAGRASIWLATRGMRVVGCDISSVAIDLARARAAALGVADRCTFLAADLDDGLAVAGPFDGPFDVVFCHLFRDASLDHQIVSRLAPGGLLAVAALSEVGAEPGPFRARRGELRAAFAELEPIAGDEADGVAWLLARRVDH